MAFFAPHYLREREFGAIVPQSKPRKATAVDEQLTTNIAKLQTVARNLVESSFQAETRDHQDHTFSGIMFPVECLNRLPVQFVEIQSVAVRGDLGRVTVYTCACDVDSARALNRAEPAKWIRRFGPTDLPSSRINLVDLPFAVPLRLAPSQFAGIYIHSEQLGDRAIVYDNQRHSISWKDDVLTIHPGHAHTSHIPFSNINGWGGDSWRRYREFVGRITFGTKFLLWTPLAHSHFPTVFRDAVFSLLCSYNQLGKQPTRKIKTLGDIPVDVLYQIINFMPHDWFGEPDFESEGSDDEEDDDDDAVDDADDDDEEYDDGAHDFYLTLSGAEDELDEDDFD